MRCSLRSLFSLAACAGYWACALICALLLSESAASQEPAAPGPNTVKAAFLRNFAHYVNWPETAFPDPGAPWHVCVLGPDPFGDVLEKTLTGRKEQSRPFAVFRAERLEDLPTCQILFVAYPNAGKRRAVLSALKARPVLTVGDAPDFLAEGGVIRFQVGDRVGMAVNLDQARAGSLTVQTKMLEVSSEILENGVIRRAR